ncbi:MAG TPA: hypothetical protein VI701_06445 [Anaerolineales bacterium]|nr:hypothetical protein [Anaerolineales bacterium]
MKLWRAVIAGSLAAALAVILATAFLAAEGRIHLPWPMMAPQIGTRLGWLGAHRLAAAGPYIEATAGLLLQFLLGALILYLMPERMRRLTDAVTGGRAIGRYLAIGLVLTLGLGAVALLSAFYLHTALLPFVLAGILILAALAGAEALALGLGRELLRRAAWSGGSPLVALLVGTTLLYALTRLPYAAPVVMAVLALTGAGAALSTRFGGRRTWTLDPLREVSER